MEKDKAIKIPDKLLNILSKRYEYFKKKNLNKKEINDMGLVRLEKLVNDKKITLNSYYTLRTRQDNSSNENYKKVLPKEFFLWGNSFIKNTLEKDKENDNTIELTTSDVKNNRSNKLGNMGKNYNKNDFLNENEIKRIINNIYK